MPRLRRVLCTSPGFARKPHGRGFIYVDERGRRIARAATLERIRSLAIPPAWTDVWICPDELGHLQAVGIDAAGRRQYLYHPDWRARRDQQKFARAERFAGHLPDLRSQVALDLAERGLVRERVLGGALRLLDRGVFRIGSEDYAERNGSFGLATLRRSHISYQPSRGRGRVPFPREGRRAMARHGLRRGPREAPPLAPATTGRRIRAPRIPRGGRVA
jgi:DNA topoisomerase I